MFAKWGVSFKGLKSSVNNFWGQVFKFIVLRGGGYFFQRVDTGRACKFLPKDTGSLPVYRMMPR